MDDSQAARPYAVAAFSYAREHDNIAEWGNFMSALAESVNAVYKTIRGRKLIADEILMATSEKISFLKLSVEQKNFLAAITDAGRLSLFQRITDMYEELRLAHDGVVRVRVETAMSMGLRARRDFNASLESWLDKKRIGTKALVEYEENPDLIGGVRVYIRDDVLDASVLGRLNKMKQVLGI